MGSFEDSKSLPESVAELFVEQFRSDIGQGEFRLAQYALADLSMIAHSTAEFGVAWRSERTHKINMHVLELVWKAAKVSLSDSQPHFVLMLLNSLVKAGPEEMLISQEFLDAVDEHLSQKLDYPAEVLGT